MRRTTRRRGATYAIVLLTTLLVATIGFSGVAVARLQGKSVAGVQDVSAARRLASAGLEWSLMKIAADTNWRNTLANGTWANSVAAGAGSFTVTAADPVDSDVRTGALDPVDLTFRGEQKSARHMFQARLELNPQRTVLDTALSAGGTIAITDGQLDAGLPLYSVGNLTASSASVRADCESGGTVSGSTYYGVKSNNVSPRPFPPVATVFDYYLANGTSITFANIGNSSASEIIQNGSFGSGTSNWSTYGSANINPRSTGGPAGSTAPWLEISGRGSADSGPGQDIKNNLGGQGTGTYRFRGVVWGGSAGDPMDFVATFEYKGSGNTITTTAPLITGAKGAGWAAFDVQVVLNWGGSLGSAQVRITTPGDDENFSVDSLSLQKVCITCPRVMEGVLLSPQVNPYGGANPQGIYIIDCGGNDLTIQYARIVGTLIIRNPGPNSALDKHINWEPAVSNYPVMMVDGNFAIKIHDHDLKESEAAMNLNPAGTPYRYAGGTTDSDSEDKYPGFIGGLVYVKGNLTLTDKPTFGGPVIVTGNVTAGKDRVKIDYSGDFALLPPPGFESLAPKPRLMAGSVAQVVDP